jgi:hypothetical protein
VGQRGEGVHRDYALAEKAQATKSFQTRHESLVVDGMVGPMTLGSLDHEVAGVDPCRPAGDVFLADPLCDSPVPGPGPSPAPQAGVPEPKLVSGATLLHDVKNVALSRPAIIDALFGFELRWDFKVGVNAEVQEPANEPYVYGLVQQVNQDEFRALYSRGGFSFNKKGPWNDVGPGEPQPFIHPTSGNVRPGRRVSDGKVKVDKSFFRDRPMISFGMAKKAAVPTQGKCGKLTRATGKTEFSVALVAQHMKSRKLTVLGVASHPHATALDVSRRQAGDTIDDQSSTLGVPSSPLTSGNIKLTGTTANDAINGFFRTYAKKCG